jgi:hypothetical protein
MLVKHPISLIQKFQFERVGYDEYYKSEYANICRFDNIVRLFQVTTNEITDYFKSGVCLPLLNPEDIEEIINIVASTDVLEFLMRKKKLLLINVFGCLSNAGIVNYTQLYNELTFPRSNLFRDLAKIVLQAFPRAWQVAMEQNIEINTDITYAQEYPKIKFQLVPHNAISVRSLRLLLGERVGPPVYPYNNFDTFELLVEGLANPFVKIRKCIQRPRARIFKYRILQGDIFCKKRMFNFKMVANPYCDTCGKNLP